MAAKAQETSAEEDERVSRAIYASEARVRQDIASLREELLNSPLWQNLANLELPASCCQSAGRGVERPPPALRRTSPDSDSQMGEVEYKHPSIKLCADVVSEEPVTPSSSPTPPDTHMPYATSGSATSRALRELRQAPSQSSKTDAGLVHKHSTATSRFWHRWPASIPIHSVFFFEEGDAEHCKATLEAAARRFHDLTLHHNVTSTRGYVLEAASPYTFLRMIRPDSERRVLFDLISMLVLAFDVVYTPYYITWQEVVSHDLALGIMMGTTIWWLLEMCLSFVTGIFTEKGLELRFKNVACHYLKTRFLIDFLCLAADFLNLVPLLAAGSSSSSSSTKLVRFVRIAKLARFLRVVGVLRLLRVLQVLNMYMESVLSESWSMVIRIVQISCCLLWLCHLVACGWYAIGAHAPQEEIEDAWVDTPIGLEGQYTVRNLSSSYQYVLSYEWALAQLVLGSHDVSPINSIERIFTIVCHIFALIFGGTLVSILSTTLINLKEINHDRTSKVRLLKDFLFQHQVNGRVRIQILRQVQDRARQRDRTLVEQNVPTLQLLSHSLLRDLRHSLFARHVRTHSLFCAWGCVDLDILRYFCGEGGMEFVCYLAEDEIFRAAEVASAGYHCVSGTLEYKLEARSILEGVNALYTNQVLESETLETLEKGAWFCEASWWMIWCHVGTATAREPTLLLSLPPEAVEIAMSSNLTIQVITREYARLFHQRATNSWGAASIPTDIAVPSAQLSDLIFAMSGEVQIILGTAALRQAVHQLGFLAATLRLARLQGEIEDGSAIVLFDEKGSLQRQVSLIVLRIENHMVVGKQKVLAEVAMYDPATRSWQARIRLPGTKQKFGETQEQALERLVLGHLDGIRCCGDGAGSLKAQSCGRSEELEVAASARYGIGTTYRKNIFTASVSEEGLQSISEFAHSTAHADGSLPEVVAVSSMLSSPKEGRDRTFQAAAAAAAATVIPRSHASLRESKDLSYKGLLKEIDEVYVLAGHEQVGIYAWFDDYAISELTPQKDLVTTWVEAIVNHSLPQDIAEHMARSAQPYGTSIEMLSLV